MNRLLWLLLLIFAATSCNSGEEITITTIIDSSITVMEYTPAPGQFINDPVMSGFDNVTTPAEACAYAAARLADKNWVSLGGWGGYIVARFAEPVPATHQGRELLVAGNTFDGSSEPGVVWVMHDADGNGLPDERWYSLRGSEYDRSEHAYAITYTRPADFQPVPWRDKQGVTGTIDRIGGTDGHMQAQYYPAWLADTHIYKGVLLPSNITEPTPGYYVMGAFTWGYVDNSSPTDLIGGYNRLSIADALTDDGQKANLTQVDFIKIQCGVNDKRPNIGEISTEVSIIACLRTVTSGN